MIPSARIAALLAACALPFAGCSGLDTGNADASIKVAVLVGPGSPVDSQGTEFVITTAVASVRDVDLYLPAGTSCAGLAGLDPIGGDHTVVCEGDHIRARGPWQVDLVADTAVPALPLLPAVVGTYRRIDVRFDPDDSGTTLAVTGTFPLNGQSMPFAMNLSFSETLRFEGNDIVATADAVTQALLRLDPSGWFAPLPLTQCIADGDFEIEDGVVELGEDADDSEACGDFEDLVRGEVRDSCELEPRHGDDDDERREDHELPPPR